MKNKQQGFTLIEVMVALVIAVVSIVGLLKATSQSATNTLYFKEKTLATIVASNLAIETRLSTRPNIGYIDKKYKMAGKEWPYRVHTTLKKSLFGPDMDMTNSEILVYASVDAKSDKQHIARVEVRLDIPQTQSKTATISTEEDNNATQ